MNVQQILWILPSSMLIQFTFIHFMGQLHLSKSLKCAFSLIEFGLNFDHKNSSSQPLTGFSHHPQFPFSLALYTASTLNQIAYLPLLHNKLHRYSSLFCS